MIVTLPVSPMTVVCLPSAIFFHPLLSGGAGIDLEGFALAIATLERGLLEYVGIERPVRITIQTKLRLPRPWATYR